jgi:hypothetical protein
VNIRSVAASSNSRSLPGSSGALRSMVSMSGKYTYGHAAMSMTSSTDAAPTAGEASGAVDITMSRSPAGGDGAESSSEGTITTLVPPEPAPVGGSDTASGAAVSTPARPSSTVAAVAGGGGAPNPSALITSGGGKPDSSTAMATGSPSSTCDGSGSAHRGLGRGSEGTTRALWAKRFRGARLSTPVSAYLRQEGIKVRE